MKGKDPAVLLYTSDFLTGITLLTDEQAGQYIKLLCQQHQVGHMPENHMISVCKSLDSPVIKKFMIDDDGLYYNERMDLEIEKRVNFCASRSHKGTAGRPKKSSDNHTKNTRQSIGNRTENENDNDIVVSSKGSSSKKKEYNKMAEEVYTVYISHLSPADKDKGRAIKNITKLLEKYDMDTLCKTIRHYGLTKKDADRKYIKNPANFFGRDGTFLGYIEKPQIQTKKQMFPM